MVPELRDAIKDYIWRGERQYAHFRPGDVQAISDRTEETVEEVERAFFELAGDVWEGTVSRRGAEDMPACAPMMPPPGWFHVFFDVERMQKQGALPMR